MNCQVNSPISMDTDAATVGPGKVVRLRFWAREQQSQELLQYGDELRYLHGGSDGMFPRVEATLAGARSGDRLELVLAAEEGYGEHDPGKLIVQPRETIPEEAWMPGYMLMGELPDGQEVPFTVVQVDEVGITLDGNHPWAGKYLHFTFEVMDVRDSTEGERRTGFILNE